MANGTIIQQGSFTSTGAAVTLNLRSGVDWVDITNYTQIGAQNANSGYQFYWQSGMPNGTGIETKSNGGATAVNEVLTANNAFTLVDTSANTTGNPIAITAGTNAVQPIYSTGSTAGLSVGSIVRLTTLTGQLNLSGMDFTIDTIVANTSFRIANPLANAPGAAATAGFWRLIPYNPLFYPSRRYVVNITQAAQAVVTVSVNHGYTVGQQIRFQVPSQFGMTEISGLTGNIVAVTASTFTVDINSTAFTPFVFPASIAVPFSQALVNPVGETANANISDPNLLDDATVNTGIIGIQLAGGTADLPAGQNGDLIFWKAGKSFNT